MESGVRTRVKTTIPRSGQSLTPRSVLITVNRGGALMDLNVTRIIKIIQFPVNIDKLTRFFDKYLKTNRKMKKSYIVIFQLVMSLY